MLYLPELIAITIFTNESLCGRHSSLQTRYILQSLCSWSSFTLWWMLDKKLVQALVWWCLATLDAWKRSFDCKATAYIEVLFKQMLILRVFCSLPVALNMKSKFYFNITKLRKCWIGNQCYVNVLKCYKYSN